jgi:alpha-glucosidase
VDGRDPERAPIPWGPPSQAGPGAGFTSGEPWLPIVADAERLAVAAQARDPGSTLSFVRRLLALRARSDALQGGAQRSVDAPPGLFCFVRKAARERLLVALNFTSERVPLGLRGAAAIQLSTHVMRRATDVDLTDVVLEPDEGLVMNLPIDAGPD